MRSGNLQPGSIQPQGRDARRKQLGRSEDWLFPRRDSEKGEDQPGVHLCPRCHAISEEKRWFYDERRYEQLQSHPDVHFSICPGCDRIERQLYGGEVQLRSPLLEAQKEQALHLIYHAEDEAKADNPISRLATVEDDGPEIRVITTTAWLAERIGKEFEKAFGGHLEVQKLPEEKFSRVRWAREA